MSHEHLDDGYPTLFFGSPKLREYFRAHDSSFSLPDGTTLAVTWPLELLGELGNPERGVHSRLALGRVTLPLDLVEQLGEFEAYSMMQDFLAPRGGLGVLPDFSLRPRNHTAPLRDARALARRRQTLKDGVERLLPLRSGSLERQPHLAIVDTGIGIRDSQECSIEPYDLLGPYPARRAEDPDGHGTDLARLARELVGPEAKISSIRAYRVGDSSGTLTTLLQGCELAVQLDADVVNLSLSVDIDELVESSCRYCHASVSERAISELFIGNLNLLLDQWAPLAIFFAAAGFEKKAVEFPARMRSIVAVGSSSSGKRPDRHSPWVKTAGPLVFAPGGTNARPMAARGASTSGFGTSFSSVVASAVAIRLLTTFPCRRPGAPTRAAVLNLFEQIGLEVLFPGGSAPYVVPEVIPTTASEIRLSCEGNCSAYRDTARHLHIRRGRLEQE
jgi:hypothetical protein